MPMSDAAARVDHLSPDQLTLLHTLVLCEVAERADQAAPFDAAMGAARRALARFAQGTYGTCERCTTPIPFERLEAVPHLGLCADCV